MVTLKRKTLKTTNLEKENQKRINMKRNHLKHGQTLKRNNLVNYKSESGQPDKYNSEKEILKKDNSEQGNSEIAHF